MLQAGVLKPVTEATPWINSFVLVESKDKAGNHKLRICLDPTNLNNAIIRGTLSFQDTIGHFPLDCWSLYPDSTRLPQRLLASATG